MSQSATSRPEGQAPQQVPENVRTLSGGTRRYEFPSGARGLIAGVFWIRAFEGSRSRGGRGQLRASYGI